MKATWHADLVWTDIKDFVEHFERALDKSPRGRVVYSFNAEHPLLGDTCNSVITWGDEQPAPHDMPRGAAGRVSIRAFRQGESQVTYSILRTILNGSPENTECLIGISQFRSDRLNVAVWEESGTAFADRLRTWLLVRWGDDGVIERATDSVPQLSERRSANIGTTEKVREAHRLRKEGIGWKIVKMTCSHETYKRWCLNVTGEDPL